MATAMIPSGHPFGDDPPFPGTNLPARQSTEPAAVQVSSAAPMASSAMSIEQQRAIAEIQTAMFVAKQFPRNVDDVIRRVRVACQRPSLASIAEFSYPRGGEEVSGPSVYLLKAIAQEWGNIEYGIRELSRTGGVSTVQAYAWDMERGAKQTLVFEVKHWRDTKKGGYAVKEERDVYELVANMGSRRLRACLEGVIPEDIKQIAIDECNATMGAMKLVTPERIAKLLEAFKEIGVTRERLEAKLARKVESIAPSVMVRLGKTYNAIKDGLVTADEAFPPLEGDPIAAPTAKGTEGVKDRLRQRTATPPAPTAEPAPEPAPEREPGED